MAELNLLPPYLKKKRQQKINIKNYILVGIAAVGVIFLLIYIPISKLIKVNSEELRYKKQAEHIDNSTISMENEKIKKEVENYRQYIEKVEYLTGKKVLVSNRIRELEEYVSSDIIFDSLTYGENGLTINATAKSLDSISDFTANIQRSGIYKNVRVSNIRMEEQKAAENNSNGSELYKFTTNAYK